MSAWIESVDQVSGGLGAALAASETAGGVEDSTNSTRTAEDQLSQVQTQFNLESRSICFYYRLIQTWQAATQSLRTEDTGKIPASDSALKAADIREVEEEDSGADDAESQSPPVSQIPKGKRAKSNSKKPKRTKDEKSGYFANSGDTHSLFKRVTPLWNTSTDAMELSDPGFHKERLEIAKKAVQAYDLFGLRDTADDIFKGDFMRSNLCNAAVHADKVCPVLSFVSEIVVCMPASFC